MRGGYEAGSQKPGPLAYVLVHSQTQIPSSYAQGMCVPEQHTKAFRVLLPGELGILLLLLLE